MKTSTTASDLNKDLQTFRSLASNPTAMPVCKKAVR